MENIYNNLCITRPRKFINVYCMQVDRIGKKYGMATSSRTRSTDGYARSPEHPS